MTIAENAERKGGAGAAGLDEGRETNSSNDEPRDGPRTEEGNPLLSEADRRQTTVRIDCTVGKRRSCKAEEEARAMEGSKKDPEAEEDHRVVVPPDGGLRAWMIMIGSFVINGVLFSVINTYSLIYIELQNRLINAGETEASSKAALVGSLTIGTTFFLSPVAGILTDKIGIQATTFLGGALASGGMLFSSLISDKVELLYLTYGVMYGLGASLAYTPSLAILGHYFKKYLGLVNGIVTAGSSIFTTLMPYVMEFLLRRFGLEGTLRSLAALTAVVMACAALFKPIPLNGTPKNVPRSKSTFRNRIKQVINLSIWKKKRYVVWASSIPLALFGYFVPYVHIGKFVATVFKDADGKLPVMCIGIASGIGRLIFGYIADLPKVNRILLQQISFVSIGILTMLLPVTTSFLVLLLISLGMGLFDGCFISLLGPIAFDICGREGATQAIGFLLGMCSIPLTVGPPIAGLLYDHTGTYTLPFLLAGIPPIFGALTMFLIRCVKETREEDRSDSSTESSANKAAFQNETLRADFLSPSFVAASKCGRHGKGGAMCRGLQPCRNGHRVTFHESEEGCERREYGNECCNQYLRYSESVPLLSPESRSFRATTRSSILFRF